MEVDLMISVSLKKEWTMSQNNKP